MCVRRSRLRCVRTRGWGFVTDKYISAQLSGKFTQRAKEVEVSHGEVLAVGKQKAEVMKALVAKLIELIVSEQL